MKKKYNINAIIVSIIISIIFVYITFDFFVIKPSIQNKVEIVYERFDSLQIFLDKKIPLIDEALKVQEQQVKELKDMTGIYKK